MGARRQNTGFSFLLQLAPALSRKELVFRGVHFREWGHVFDLAIAQTHRLKLAPTWDGRSEAEHRLQLFASAGSSAVPEGARISGRAFSRVGTCVRPRDSTNSSPEACADLGWALGGRTQASAFCFSWLQRCPGRSSYFGACIFASGDMCSTSR